MRAAFVVLSTLYLAMGAWAQVLDVLPSASLDPSVPTIQQVLGYSWGQEISDPEQITRYAHTLADSSGRRVRLIPYGASEEGRPLFLLVVGKPAHVEQLDALAERLRRWADPRQGQQAGKESEALSLPAVVWVVGSVHGDEASGGEAALALAYYLVAARSPAVEAILDRVLVVLDPMQNPDGRARFVASTRQARGRGPALDPADAEHVQPWPGGRFSHWLFDLNRDWFALTHGETQGRVERMLWLPPQVVIDLHEMSSEQGYFFPPPAAPHNPLVSVRQQKLWKLLGTRLARVFDGAGIRFWTREVFDAFYPGYGESWPFFSGACGATFEQASTRGRAVRLRTGEVLRYGDAVANHLLAAFTTLQLVAEEQPAFMESFLDYRTQAVREGKGKAYVWLDDGPGATALAELLARQGVEVYKAEGGPSAGQFFVPQAQPLGKLARVLLDREVPLPKDFQERQKKLEAKGLPDEIYDVTAWSLPLLWQVPVEGKSLELPEEAQPWRGPSRERSGVVGAGRVAFLLPWNDLGAAQAAVDLLRAGIPVAAAERGLVVAGRRFPRGSVVVWRRGAPENLEQLLQQVAAARGVTFFGTDTSLVEEGLDLGSSRVQPLQLPSVALLWDSPASPTACGHLRYALEVQLGLPVTALRLASLPAADLWRFHVLILPDAGGPAAYRRALAPETVERVRFWVREGGVLIAEGSAAAFLTEDKVGLLASKLEMRAGQLQGDAQEKGRNQQSGAKEPAPQEQEEEPPLVPGAILTVHLDEEAFLTAGLRDNVVYAMVNSRRIFTPLARGTGFNLGVFAPKEKLLASGFLFPQSEQQLPGKAFFMMQRHGRGLVLAFAEPPAFRGITRGTTQLLANAVLLGPTLAGRR